MDHDPHSGHEQGPDLLALLPAPALLACVVAYLLLAGRARRRNPVQGWSHWRTASFAVGAVVLAAALLPPVATVAHTDFRGHMAQHLMVGMYAPLALVLGAPVTLALRTLPARGGRRLTAVLRSRPARILSHPAAGLLLSTGSLVPLYFTPLYDATATRPALHWLLHAHLLLAGVLFAHAIAGPDPAPGRPGVRARLVYLGFAIAGHAVVAQLLYGGFWVDVPASVAQRQGGAELMYYGGDIAELLLAAALVGTWRPERRDRRPASVPVGLPPVADGVAHPVEHRHRGTGQHVGRRGLAG
ncbi:cytochrome c oxidase assembly protein [Micromonospora costi]|uniref:Cytochrome c oxidase assembly protein n=1 Tax=Micromonospora costi TaxID=1530042 RepID=A0A3A9ZXT9_9ACTN|nr:cytochrome c oxidase assembly protein [Micromonospora costi]RKN52136.1 cytochrome c oxidase assembly protein [Micromonospora costi]